MHTNGQHNEHTVEIGGEVYDLSEYDFPTRMDSPDPKRMIEAIIDCGGVLDDAAEEVGCARRTIYNWVHRFGPVEAAVNETRASVAYRAREKLIDLMNDGADRVAYKAAIKILTMFHPRLDWSRKERREITRKTEKQQREQIREDLDEMDADELLARYNQMKSEG